jgi:hypothetical protein
LGSTVIFKRDFKLVRQRWKAYSTWPVIIKLFPARESLVSDIPAGDGKIANFFYSAGTRYGKQFYNTFL